MNNESDQIVRKGDIINVRIEALGAMYTVIIRAVNEFEVGQLFTAIEVFSTTKINSHTTCENENCDEYGATFDPCYELCPYCGQVVDYKFVKPTIWQFLASPTNNLVEAVSSESMYVDDLTYF